MQSLLNTIYNLTLLNFGIFTHRIRGAALSVAAAAQWIANFAVSTTFPPLKDVGLGFAYGLYTTAAAISLFFVLLLLKKPRVKN